MQKRFGWLLVVIVFYACNNNNGAKNSISKATPVKPDKESNIAPADTATDVRFKQFWKQFKLAVKNNDKNAIIKLTYFPIHNLHPCYLPTAGETRVTDTVGLSQAAFNKLTKKIFDDETSWLTSTPADSLYLYEKKNDDKNLPLEKIVDNNTPVYEYAVVYNQGSTGGNKSLYFGNIKGAYKLIWIECDGNATGH